MHTATVNAPGSGGRVNAGSDGGSCACPDRRTGDPRGCLNNRDLRSLAVLRVVRQDRSKWIDCHYCSRHPVMGVCSVAPVRAEFGQALEAGRVRANHETSGFFGGRGASSLLWRPGAVGCGEPRRHDGAGIADIPADWRLRSSPPGNDPGGRQTSFKQHCA